MAIDIARNSGIFTAGRWIGKLLGLFTVIILAPYFLPELFGQYSLIIVFLGFFLFLNDFGVYTLLIREISRDKSKAREYLGNALGLKLVLSVFALILTVLAAHLMGYPPEITLPISIYAVTILIGGIGSVFGILFQANLKMEYEVISEFIERVLFLGIVLFVIYNLPKEQAMVPLFIGLVFSVLIANIVKYFFFRRLISIRPMFNFTLWKSFLKAAWPFALLTFFVAIYGRIDVLMLSKMSGEAAVGFYSSGYRLTDSLTLIPTALVISLFPLMSHYHKTSKDKLVNMHRLAFKYIVILALPMAVGTAFLSDKILLTLYGAEFFKGEPLGFLNLAILIFATLFVFLNYVNNYLLNSMNREKTALAVLSAGIVVNVFLNFLLIPDYSYIGAAFATLVTEILVFAVFVILVWRLLYLIGLGVFVRPLIASAIMASIIILLPEISLFIVVPLAALAYFISLYIIRGFTHQDKDILKRIIFRG
ncbi:flippase [Candidatus Micrarchaeota archaeon]|nr:flippase [Candidatus Micrarchaeota archaeon]